MSKRLRPESPNSQKKILIIDKQMCKKTNNDKNENVDCVNVPSSPHNKGVLTLSSFLKGIKGVIKIPFYQEVRYDNEKKKKIMPTDKYVRDVINNNPEKDWTSNMEIFISREKQKPENKIIPWDKQFKWNYKKTNIGVIDFDAHTYDEIIENHPELEDCICTTGRSGRGFHFYVTNDEFIGRNNETAIDYKVDGCWGHIFELNKAVISHGTKIKNISLNAIKCLHINKLFKTHEELQKEEEENEIKRKAIGHTKINEDEITELVDILDEKYYGSGSWDNWKKICYLLIKNGYRELAHKFSAKSESYSYVNAEEHFRSLELENWDKLTIGSLYYYCKDSDFDKYIQIRNKYRKEPYKEFGHIDLAYKYCEENDDIFCHSGDCYKCIFVYNEKKKIWDQLAKDDKGAIRSNVFKYFKAYFQTQLSDIYIQKSKIRCEYEDTKCEGCPMCDKKSKLKGYEKIIEKNLKQLNSHSYMSYVASAVKDWCEYEKKEIVMDSNGYLFCWDNKTFDLKNKEFYERDKYDYITQTCGYDYEDPTQEGYNTCEKIFNEIHPDKDIRDCHLSVLKTCLIGEKQQYFICCNGMGRNGKGFVSKLMKALLGNYAYFACSSIIQQTIDGSKPNPSVALINNKRGIVIAELDDSKPASCNAIKNLTGEDVLNARACHSNQTQVNNKGTYIAECNDRLEMKGDTDNNSMIQRYIDINFLSTFNESGECDENCSCNHKPEDKHRYHFKQNTEWGNGVEFANSIRGSLFNYLVQYTEGNKIIVTDMVKQRSRDYLKTQNTLRSWMTETYELLPQNEKTDIYMIDNGLYYLVKDIYHYWITTPIYKDLSKEDRRKLNKEAIIKQVQQLWGHQYKERVASKRNIIIGLKEKEDPNDYILNL
jgi:phage/plasmid-associated DNA primase